MYSISIHKHLFFSTKWELYTSIRGYWCSFFLFLHGITFHAWFYFHICYLSSSYTDTHHSIQFIFRVYFWIWYAFSYVLSRKLSTLYRTYRISFSIWLKTHWQSITHALRVVFSSLFFFRIYKMIKCYFVWMLHTVNDFIHIFFSLTLVNHHISACIRVTKPLVAFSSHFNSRLFDLIITKIIYTSQNIYENEAFSVDVNEKKKFFSQLFLCFVPASKSVNVTLHFRLTHKSTMWYQVNVTFSVKYLFINSR